MIKVIVHWPAVIAAAFAKFAIGAVWYTALFGKMWMDMQHFDANMQVDGATMGKMYGGSFLGYLLQAYVMVHFIQYSGAKDSKGGMQTGFWLWLGFTFVLLLQGILYEMKPMGLLFVNGGYELVSLLAMGAILAAWKKKETTA